MDVTVDTLPAAPKAQPVPAAQPGPQALDGGIMEAIRAAVQTMTQAEQRVGRWVLHQPGDVLRLSVTETAQAVGVSPATVVRFSQSLGLRGFQELKLRLAGEVLGQDQRLPEPVDAGDGYRDITVKVLRGGAEALIEASRSVDGEVLERIASAAARARRILLVAVGTSAPLAQDAAYRLTTAGLCAMHLPDPHAQHVAAALTGPQDLCLAISHTGSTFETLAAMRAAREAGAQTAAVTSFARSPLTELAELVVVGGSRETAHRIEALSSRLVHLSILDALFSLVVVENPGTAQTVKRTQDVIVEHRL
ncbi:MAG: MurR/RpiR family transcriptional regulator [Bifidobacteriaceae bacterium]|nr:MurR/RpiR family transcriptional regulator [Bifidobacteriaceae bacterium]